MKKVIYVLVLTHLFFILSYTVTVSADKYYCAPLNRLSITTNPNRPVNYEYPNKINRLDWTQDTFRMVPDIFPFKEYFPSPFSQIENPGLIEIIYNKDYLPEDGWELLRYTHAIIPENDTIISRAGIEPFFVLYNKYRGIIRLFIMLNPNYKTDYNYLLGIYGFYSNYMTSSIPSSLLSNIPPLSSLDNFNNSTRKSYKPYYFGKGFWNWNEIEVMYDPCGCKDENLLVLYTTIFMYKDIEIDGQPGIIYSEFQFSTPIFGIPGGTLINEIYHEAYYPLYNNLLGTFNMLRTPEIHYSSRFTRDYEYKFKLARELEYVVNPAAGFVMDSINLNARYVIKFNEYPALRDNEYLIQIDDYTYETIDIPIGCLQDFTLSLQTPFSNPPNQVSLVISGDFPKVSTLGKTDNQFLEKVFQVNLTNYKEKNFNDSYWFMNYALDCDKHILPYNLNYQKMEEFCNSENYQIQQSRWTIERATRNIIDSVEFVPASFTETRIYELYPNPASDKLNIEFAVQEEANIDINIIDLLGREVKELSLSFTKPRGRYLYEIPLNKLANGSYLVVFESGNIRQVKPLIILK